MVIHENPLHGIRHRSLAVTTLKCVARDVRLDDVSGKGGATSLLSLQLPSECSVTETEAFILQQRGEFRADVFGDKFW